MDSRRLTINNARYEVPYKWATNFIFQITLNKNTIASNSRHSVACFPQSHIYCIQFKVPPFSFCIYALFHTVITR